MTAARKRPVSKLDNAVQTINKRERRALDLLLVGRWNHLDLTVAACKHLHVTGKNSNGLEVWGEEKDTCSRTGVWSAAQKRYSGKAYILPVTGGTA